MSYTERDADGLLPYSGDLRVPDDRKKRPSDDVHGQNSISAGKSGGTSGQESMSGAIDLRTLNNQVRSKDNSGHQFSSPNDAKDENTFTIPLRRSTRTRTNSSKSAGTNLCKEKTPAHLTKARKENKQEVQCRVH